MKIVIEKLFLFFAPYLSKYRRTKFVSSVAQVCRLYLQGYSNFDYNFSTNGEKRVIDTLSRFSITDIIEVGANVGEWTSLTAELFPNATIHAFEIVPDTAALLKENAKSFGNVEVNACGLSDSEGEIDVRYFSEASHLSTVMNYDHAFSSSTIKGSVITGDEYARRKGIQKIGFLKIDVEGAEHLVLKGFDKYISSGAVDAIQFEYGRVNILSRFLLQDFYKVLTSYGYVIGKIYPTYVDFKEYALSDEDFAGANFLAVLSERNDLVKDLSGK